MAGRREWTVSTETTALDMDEAQEAMRRVAAATLRPPNRPAVGYPSRFRPHDRPDPVAVRCRATALATLLSGG